MKIGVIADTHLAEPTSLLRKTVDKFFKDADLILHAGDIYSGGVLEALGPQPVYAVAGNRDRTDIADRLPDKRIIEADGFRIGLVHGWGSPLGLRKRVRSAFKDVHCLVFGHSHWAMNREKDGILYFNPGSFRRDIFSGFRRTIGIITTATESLSGRIVHLESQGLAPLFKGNRFFL